MANTVVAKLGIAAVAATFAAVLAIVAWSLFAPNARASLYGAPPPAGLEDLPRVTQSTADGRTRYQVDWDLASAAQRGRTYGQFTVDVQLTDASGAPVSTADVVLLQGRHFAGRLQTGRGTNLQVTFLSGGPLTAWAASPSGAASLTCRSVRRGVDDGFLCAGRLSEAVRVTFPSPPACPQGPESQVLAAAFPEACFGLTALELTHLPQELSYQPRRDADALVVTDGHGAIWSLAPKLGQRTRAMSVQSKELLREPQLVRALEADLGPGRPLPASERAVHWLREKHPTDEERTVRLFGDATTPFTARLTDRQQEGTTEMFELTLTDAR